MIDVMKRKNFYKVDRYNRELDWIAERGGSLSGYINFYSRFRRSEEEIQNIYLSDVQALNAYLNDLPDYRS